MTTTSTGTVTAPKGLRIEVYRARGMDCTAGGVSSNHDELTLVGTLHDGDTRVEPLPDGQVFAVTEDAPAVALRARAHIWPGEASTAALVPVVWNPQAEAFQPAHPGTMAGGNYAATSDSRFSAAVSRALGGHRFYGAVAVHDRIEH